MSRHLLRKAAAPVALAASLLSSASARAGDFVDLRLSFNITDENVLVKPGETTPSIPGLRIGAPIPRWGTLFFDNYDTRFTGFENLTHMVLYKKLQDGQEDFEGAFVLRFNTLSDNLSSIYDGGSYLTWTHWLDPARKEKNNFSITAFPLSGDRLRLGYSYKISWGGSPIFFKANPDNPFASTGSSNPAPAPAVRAQYATENSYAFLALKSSILLNKAINEQEAVYGILGGAGYDVTKELRLEANGGYFSRGVNPKQEVLGQSVAAYGASGQVTYHKGMPIGRSVDFALYRNDPTSAQRFFTQEEYAGGLSWLVSSEGTFTQQTLQDPDNVSATKRQTGMAADVNIRVKYNFARFYANFMVRDLSFMLMNVPSFVPFQALSKNADVTPETFISVGGDYFFEKPRLTLGLTGGVQMPASFTGNLPTELIGNLPPEALPKSSTVVVRSEGLFDILRPGDAPHPIYAAKATALWQRNGFNIVGEVLFGYDDNATRLERETDPATGQVNPESIPKRVPGNPYQLGFNLSFQARL